MGIQYGSKDILLVNLPWSLQEHDERYRVVEMVRERGRNVVVDFSNVDVAGCTTFTRFLEWRQLLQDCGGKLVLCRVAPATQGCFHHRAPGRRI
ncbi:MAG: hypothetical protein A2Y76_13110 [Planctomycetes bacterium RBG_13_60_9]|nr:MAG: hypothetical protein A2Y76_13110 [Planctomycetes bacterium RBG_13_60_9]